MVSKSDLAYPDTWYSCFFGYVLYFERNTMRKLALSDEILMKVDKAARYIGGEVNSVMKDKNDVDIRFAMCFPDVCDILFPSLFSTSI